MCRHCRRHKMQKLPRGVTYSHWVARQHGVALILLLLWRASEIPVPVSIAFLVFPCVPCALLFRYDQVEISANFLRHQTIKTPAPILHGRAPLSGFLLKTAWGSWSFSHWLLTFEKSKPSGMACSKCYNLPSLSICTFWVQRPQCSSGGGAFSWTKSIRMLWRRICQQSILQSCKAAPIQLNQFWFNSISQDRLDCLFLQWRTSSILSAQKQQWAWSREAARGKGRERERELCPRKIKKDDWNLSLLLLFLLLFLFVLLSWPSSMKASPKGPLLCNKSCGQKKTCCFGHLLRRVVPASFLLSLFSWSTPLLFLTRFQQQCTLLSNQDLKLCHDIAL